MAVPSIADRETLRVDRRDKKCGSRYMGDPSLTAIIAHRSTPSTVNVNVAHTSLEIIHRVRVGPIWTTRHGSGVPFSSLAFFLFPKALCSLLLFLANAVLLIFLPTNTPRGDVRTRRGASRAEARSRTIPSLPSHLFDSKTIRNPNRSICN